MEYWNSGAPEGRHGRRRLGQLGLFGAIGSSHGPACPSGGGKLGLFVRRAPSRSGGIGFVYHRDTEGTENELKVMSLKQAKTTSVISVPCTLIEAGDYRTNVV